MKIIYHHRTLADGAEGIHIAEMVNAFRQLGHEVFLIGPGVKQEGPGEGRSSRFLWVKRLVKGPFYELAELAYNLLGYRTLSQAVQDIAPDFIYDRYITFNYSAVAVARRWNVPIFLEVNSPLAYERDHEADETLFLKRIAYAIEKKVCCDASKVIVVSTPLKKYLQTIGVSSRKIAVLPNGVNLEKFYPRQRSTALLEELSLGTDDMVIGFVGILRPWHGIDILLEAFATVSRKWQNCRLLLVGDGPIQEEIEAKAEQLGLGPKVSITGRVSHEKVADYVTLFDVAVSPKATFYASPMKIIEYMAQQKAVVAPNMENIADLVDDGETGLLFQAEQAESLAEALGRLIADESLRETMGRGALLSVTKRLNWKNNARFIVDTQRKMSA